MEQYSFALDKYRIKKKRLSIADEYIVSDEHGKDVIFVKRPAHLLKNVLLLIGVIVATLGLVTLTLLFLGLEGPTGILVLVAELCFLVCAVYKLIPRRHIYIYADETFKELLLIITHDKKEELLNSAFTLWDTKKNCLARFRRRWLRGVVSKEWEVLDPTGNMICEGWGSFMGNFNIDSADKRLGELNRKLAAIGKYSLDMTYDKEHKLNRRVALALSVLHDTIERRGT